MKFKFFAVCWDDDSTGDGERYVLTASSRDAHKIAEKQAKEEFEQEMDLEECDRSGTSTVSVQEYQINGTPTEITAAALVAINSDSMEWSESCGIKRANIKTLRRFSVNYYGRWVKS